MGDGSRRTGILRFAFAWFLVRRTLLAVLVLFGVIVITFFLSRVVPADPAGLWAGPHARTSDLLAARAALHLDESKLVQFWYYLSGLLHGDLGISLRTHSPVLNDIRTNLPATLELIIAAEILAILIGIPLGVYAGIRKGAWPDSLTRGLAVSGVSVPTFWLAVMLQILFVF
ncbi:MAG: ABC transporter permease, partial [Thermoplasmata archaeon]|nr:ABC transporter permease [Thermoplasmata archaeon]